jgi:hypothetical protein
LDQAGGVKKRLADLVPSAKAGKTAKTGKAAKKEDKKKLKLKLGKSAKSLAYKKRKAAQKEKRRNAAAAAASAQSGGLLGQEGGPLTGCRVRLVDFVLPDLLRNTPAVVQVHYTTGLLVVECVSGSTRSFKEELVYPLTGHEKLPLPLRTPDLRHVTKEQKAACLSACGAQLHTKLIGQTLLESPELASGWHELGFRAQKAGVSGPTPWLSV